MVGRGGYWGVLCMCVMGHLGRWGHGGGGVCLDEGQWGCVGVGI